MRDTTIDWILVLATLASGAVACSGAAAPDPQTSDGSVPTTKLPPDYKPLPCSGVGRPCDAQDPCAIDPTCGPDKLCWPRALQRCSDGLDCTDDVCLGAGLCDHRPREGSCALPVKTGDAKSTLQCTKKGDRRPGHPCHVCDPAVSATRWSPATAIACDDGDPCTKNDTCVAGACAGTFYGGQCYDDFVCTEDLCDGTGGCLGHKMRAGWCLINGTCVLDGGKKPDGSCAACDPKTSVNSWTPFSGACTIDGKCWKSGDKHPKGCASCDPTVDAKTWTVNPGSCLIGGRCYAKGAQEAGGCGSCDPSAKQTAWHKGPGCFVVHKWSTAPGLAPGGGVAVDGSGNVYVLASRYDFGVLSDIIASYTPDGALRWVRFISDKQLGEVASADLAVDRAGNVYIAGLGVLGSMNYTAFVLVSYTKSGVRRWAHRDSIHCMKCYYGSCPVTPPCSWSRGEGVATDSAGNVYVRGSHTDWMTIGSTKLPDSGGFLAAFDSKGSPKWARAVPVTIPALAYPVPVLRPIAADAQGNVTIADEFSKQITIDSTVLTPVGKEIFAAVFDSTGKTKLVKSLGKSNGYVRDLAVDKAGTILLLRGSALSSYTPSGQHSWSVDMLGATWLGALATDSENTAYVTGTFKSSLSVGKLSLKGSSTPSMFLAALDAEGTPLWVRHASPGTTGTGIATYGEAIYAAGLFDTPTADLGGGPIKGFGPMDYQGYYPGTTYLAKFAP